MNTDDIEIRYPEGQLADLARECEVWTDSFLDDLFSKGVYGNSAAEKLAAALPAKFMPVLYYDAAFRGTVQYLQEMASKGELVKLGDGYIRQRDVMRIAERAAERKFADHNESKPSDQCSGCREPLPDDCRDWFCKACMTAASNAF